jgi:hypothetical protein
VRYSDYLSLSSLSDQSTKSHEVRVGLLGSIDATRRDYVSLVSALQAMPSDVRDSVILVVLGTTSGEESDAVIAELGQFVRIETGDPYLPDPELVRLGLSCHVLLAPLSSSMGYGFAKGTGAFGDAVMLHKRLLIPAFADPRREFAGFCDYYANSQELAQMLTRCPLNWAEATEACDFHPYSSSVVRVSLSEIWPAALL